MKKDIYLFTSERLGFRTWKDQDLNSLFELCSDIDVMHYFPNVMSLEQTSNLLKKFKEYYTKYGFCFYCVERLATHEFIGFIGFSKALFESKFTPCIEIGWRLNKAFWNQGFATEGAIACLDYGYKNLDISTVYSFTACINKPSERIMQKIGMTKECEFDHPNVSDDHILKKHVLYKTIRDD